VAEIGLIKIVSSVFARQKETFSQGAKGRIDASSSSVGGNYFGFFRLSSTRVDYSLCSRRHG